MPFSHAWDWRRRKTGRKRHPWWAASTLTSIAPGGKKCSQGFCFPSLPLPFVRPHSYSFHNLVCNKPQTAAALSRRGSNLPDPWEGVSELSHGGVFSLSHAGRTPVAELDKVYRNLILYLRSRQGVFVFLHRSRTTLLRGEVRGIFLQDFESYLFGWGGGCCWFHFLQTGSIRGWIFTDFIARAETRGIQFYLFPCHDCALDASRRKTQVCFQRIQVPFGKGHEGTTSRSINTPLPKSLDFPLPLSQLFLATSLIRPGTEAIQECFGQFSLPFQNEDCFDSVFVSVLAACVLRSRQNAPRWRGGLSHFGSDGLDGPAGQHPQTRPSSYLFSIPHHAGSTFQPISEAGTT